MRFYLTLPLFLLFTQCCLVEKIAAQQIKPGIPSLKYQDSVFALQLIEWRHNTASRPPAFPFRSVNAKKNKENYISNALTGKAETAYCYDTSGRFLIKTDTITYYAYTTTRTKDGMLLITGEYGNNNTFQFGGFAMKTDEYGNTLWTKLYDSAGGKNAGFISYYRATELKDGSLLFAGATPDPITDNYDVICTRTDANGNIIWSKTYKARVWKGTGYGSDSYFYLQQVSQDPETGDLFFSGAHWTDGHSITRLSLTDGKVMWSKSYQLWDGTSFDRPFGFDINGNEIRSFSKFISYDLFLSIYRINKNTGDTLETKYFKLSDTAGTKPGILGSNPLKKLSNGHYVVSGSAYGYNQYFTDSINPLYQASFAEFDENLHFTKAYSFRNKAISNSSNLITIYPDGSGLFSMLEYVSSYTANLYYVQFKGNQILRRRIRHYTEGIPYMYDATRLNDGGDLIIKLVGDSATNINKVEFLKLHIADTASDCLGMNDYTTFIQPHSYITGTRGLDSISVNIFFEAPNKTLSTSEVFSEQLPGCARIAYCDTISIVPVKDTVCIGQDALFHIRKNAACGATPYFNYDTTGVTSFTQLNDSTFRFRFGAAWKGFVKASISTCIVVEDSAHLTVLPSPKQLNLGKDTSICPANTLILNAHTGFLSYQWQDGSTDSIFSVTQPGKYYVTTINACGDFFSDTVVISAHPPIAFNVGPDITLCQGETTTIIAPGTFSNYQWLPDYNITGNNTRTANIFPVVDTTYTISAEKTPGCFAYDTIRVTVKQSPDIKLGNDTSFCSGESVILNAGTGFDSYLWNNNATTQQITVSSTGTYSVVATLNGCSKKDTLTIVNVASLPVFTLGNDTLLCDQQVRSYQFNLPDATYTWSDGKHTNNNIFSTAGMYWLNVTQQGCSKTDTIVLDYKPLPHVQLGNDTTICEGSSIMLNATNNNAQYTWQDGSNTPGYLVNNAGQYIVTVNMADCITKDTINIYYTALPSFTLGNDFFLCKGLVYTLSPAMNTTVNYHWQDGSTLPTLTLNTDGVYTLTATNNCGSLTDSITITTGICQLQMPTAFSPNNDGNNDIFRIKYPFPVKQFNMAIYNRWGQKIFESSDIYKGWNGSYKGTPASTGTYIWIIALTDAEGKTQNAKGSILLIR